jgi:hypothetical protein
MPKLPKTGAFPCPKCSQWHEVAFSEIEKKRKSKSVFVFEGGCSLTPDETREIMAKFLVGRFRKLKADLSK